MSITVTILTALLGAAIGHTETATLSAATPAPSLSLKQICVEQLKSMPGQSDDAEIEAVCEKVQQLPGCVSAQGVPIFHFDKQGTSPAPKKIFAKALIHGDERIAGNVARAWMARMLKIETRNSWRVIAVANPDGFKAGTRTNSRGVDLNRNFPTVDWDESALKYWREKTKSDARRNPGSSPASEIETVCLVKHFDDFQPDFVISVHTPLGVLDLDGPKVKNPPRFNPLAWISLGNFPGSLGRYLWMDRKIPVLTIELKGNEDLKKLEAFDRLQDISGTVAIQADQLKKKKN